MYALLPYLSNNFKITLVCNSVRNLLPVVICKYLLRSFIVDISSILHSKFKSKKAQKIVFEVQNANKSLGIYSHKPNFKSLHLIQVDNK